MAISALVVVFAFALLFLLLFGSFERAMTFRDALIFSFRTFTSSELDSHITPLGAIEWLVMFESLLGYVVMMLLVITLSRIVIRS